VSSPGPPPLLGYCVGCHLGRAYRRDDPRSSASQTASAAMAARAAAAPRALARSMAACAAADAEAWTANSDLAVALSRSAAADAAFAAASSTDDCKRYCECGHRFEVFEVLLSDLDVDERALARQVRLSAIRQESEGDLLPFADQAGPNR
jgi:hypothetical protein